MLRRKKDILELPERIVEIVPCEFDKEEREFYNSIESKVDGTINKLRQMGDVSKNYTSMLVLLLRLRQGTCVNLCVFTLCACLIHIQLAIIPRCCQKTSLTTRKRSIRKQRRTIKASKMQTTWWSSLDKWVFRQPENVKCVKSRKSYMILIVYMSKTQGFRLSSENSTLEAKFCNDCDKLARRKSIDPSATLPQDSAKIRKILSILEDIEERSGGMEKTIIFSQFTSMLDVIQPFLRHRGIKFVRCKLHL